MAVTKTHPIKSTLKAAIDYILNPEKTDGKLLASSFGCGLETADIEFAWTREAAGDRGTHLGRHLIQSFAVGETTPEEAHKIGMELAGAVLGGKYFHTVKVGDFPLDRLDRFVVVDTLNVQIDDNPVFRFHEVGKHTV